MADLGMLKKDKNNIASPVFIEQNDTFLSFVSSFLVNRSPP